MSPWSAISSGAAVMLMGGLVMPVVQAEPDAGTLTLFADGEALANDGFLAPRLTRDGWTLQFTSVAVTLANIVAHRTDPPYDAGSGGPLVAEGSAPLIEAPLTVELVTANETGLVEVASVVAPVGFYNALSFDLVPGANDASIVLEGRGRRGEHVVDFRLISSDRMRHRCGEYVGEVRKGLLVPGGAADLVVTFHLDHLFGRADLPADDAMNEAALGFDAFASGGEQRFSLAQRHLGHVGEGHCRVEPL